MEIKIPTTLTAEVEPVWSHNYEVEGYVVVVKFGHEEIARLPTEQSTGYWMDDEEKEAAASKAIAPYLIRLFQGGLNL